METLSFIEILKSAFFGIVEGITEWLPISSTGHLILVNKFINMNVSQDFYDMFKYVIQLAAIIAVIVIYWKKMWPFGYEHQQKKIIVKKSIFTIWFKVVVACLPSMIGLLLDDWMEKHCGNNQWVIASMLIIYGVAFIIIESCNRSKKPKYKTISDITYTTALAIGFFQVLAMIPGTSRSGATIVGALIIGVSRIAATDFTFYLAVPTMIGASGYKLLKFGFNFTSAELVILFVGCIVSFIVSYIAIKFLLSYIKKHNFKVFGWYRIVLGVLVILYFGIKSIA